MSKVLDSADGYKRHQAIRPDVQAAQWYFGSRTTAFYLFGIDALREALKDEPIIIDGFEEGELVPMGTPAVTITVYGNDHLYLGSAIENIVYWNLWYESTVGTLLVESKELLKGEPVIPQIRRGCSCAEQALKAERIWEKVFGKLESGTGVADHSNILLNGEDWAFEHNHCVMVDTHNTAEALKKLDGHLVMWDSGDMLKQSNEYNGVSILLDSMTRQEWIQAVSDKSDNAIMSIGSEVFQNINRDTLGLVYKLCARKVDNWEGVSKSAPNKQTLCGYYPPNYNKE